MLRKCLLFLFLASFLGTPNLSPLAGRELVAPLREAEGLYQAGQYEAAAKKAHEYHSYYPDDLQAMLICGMSEFHSKNYVEAIDMFVLASQKQPKHPIVQRYLALIRELEYRSEPFTKNLLKSSTADPLKTAKYYKRQFFGPSFTQASSQETRAPFVATLDPHLMKHTSETRAVSLVTALPSTPPVKSLLAQNTMESMAQQGLETGQFLKAYLFYSQLNASNPLNKPYLLGKAKSAFHMKRYEQVIELLGRELLEENRRLYSQEEQQEIGAMLEESKYIVFNQMN